MVRFLFPRLQREVSWSYQTSDLPRNIRLFLPAAFRRADNKTLREFGFKRDRGQRILDNIMTTIVEYSDGTLELPNYSTEQLSLLKCLTSHFTSQPAFTGERIASEFIGALVDNNILKTEELRAFQQLSDVVVLYAISVMHESIIDLADRTKASLHAAADVGRGCIGIFAKAELYSVGNEKRLSAAPGEMHEMAVPIVETTLTAAEHCERDLVINNNEIRYWDFHIELKPNRKLGKLTHSSSPPSKARRCSLALRKILLALSVRSGSIRERL